MSKAFVPKNYKTKPCKAFHENMHCIYGSRCQFLHSGDKEVEDISAGKTSGNEIEAAVSSVESGSTQESTPPRLFNLKRGHVKTLNLAKRQLELKMDTIQEEYEGADQEEMEEFLVKQAQEVLKIQSRLPIFEKITLKSSRQTKALKKKQLVKPVL